MNGGYIMIDCTGIEMTSQEKQTITGIFDKISNANNCNKPIYAVNCTWESYTMSPIAIMVNLRPSGNYIATASTLQLEIDPDDGVTIINMLAGVSRSVKSSK